MRGTRRRLVAACATFALVVGLLPAQALAATQDMAAGSAGMQAQAQDGFVADRVYAIIGDDYAMMITETGNSDAGGTQTIDIIDRAYNKTLELSERYDVDEKGNTTTTVLTDYSYGSLTSLGVLVTEKSTGLCGIIGYDAAKVVDCKYAALRWGAYGAGVSIGSDGIARLDMMNPSTAAVIASTEVGRADSVSSVSMVSDTVYVYAHYEDENGSQSKRYLYSFDGSSLTPQDAPSNNSDDVKVGSNLVIHYDYTAGYSREYRTLSGDRIASLDGWDYAGRLAEDALLFTSSDSSEARVISGADASTITSMPSGNELAGATPTGWGCTGDYVYCDLEGAQAFYSAEGSLVRVIDLAGGENVSVAPSGFYYYKYQRIETVNAHGERVYHTKPVAYYNASLQDVSIVPALGRLVHSYLGQTDLYGIGKSAEGYLDEAYSLGDTRLATADGALFTVGSFTLDRPVRSGFYPVSRSEAKFPGLDAYSAVDSSGHYGLVNSSGNAVVPFEYNDIFIGASGASLSQGTTAMAKDSNGTWRFIEVNAASNSSGDSTVQSQTMHRLYNPNSGEHFYTADEGEYQSVVAAGWRDEGTGWTAPETSDTPVFRMYNARGGEHHYCTDAGERDALVAAGWAYEGIGWYSDDAKSVPLYREYNPNAFANNHNYTTDKDEHEWLLSLGWKDEGYAWYGVK